MYEKISEQFQKSLQPVNEMISINAKVLESLAQQQNALFSNLLNQSVSFTSEAAAKKDLEGLVEAQKSYAENLQEQFSSAAKEAYEVISGAQEQAGEVLKSAIEEAQAAVNSAANAAK